MAPATGAAVGGTRLEHARAALAAMGAAVLGVAPHVLHHVGPLAGAALLAGATGKLLFAALAFLAAVPMLRRMRRRHHSWAVPGGTLALMAVIFAFSTFIVGPALADGERSAAAKPTPTAPVPGSPAGHVGDH